MARLSLLAALIVLLLLLASVAARPDPVIRLPSDGAGSLLEQAAEAGGGDAIVGTRWAVLVAGSTGYENYRHQADICHAYQILRKGGLKDENIVVFMYDDIAYNVENPRQGVIINKPTGGDVYAGVPKDYTGDNANVNNLFAVILGNKSALTGGSGKVIDSGPDDHIFIYYSDHGGYGLVGMPVLPYLYADDLNDVLKKKHASGGFKRLVFYLEACESGSMFQGLLPDDIDVYVTTASGPYEDSWGTYCPGDIDAPPPEFYTCLGDLYSVSWLEDSDAHNLRTESLEQQYKVVKARTLDDNSYSYSYGSHVMQYGNLALTDELLFLYMGTNPANDNSTFVEEAANSLPSLQRTVRQRDADLVYYWQKFLRSPEGSSAKRDAHKRLVEVMSHRIHVDNSVELIQNLLFGLEEGSSKALNAARPAGLPVVEDWACLKSMVRAFETKCGSLSQYGMKHARAFANMCNADVKPESVAAAAAQACPAIPDNPWSSLLRGFSA